MIPFMCIKHLLWFILDFCCGHKDRLALLKSVNAFGHWPGGSTDNYRFKHLTNFVCWFIKLLLLLCMCKNRYWICQIIEIIGLEISKNSNKNLEEDIQVNLVWIKGTFLFWWMVCLLGLLNRSKYANIVRLSWFITPIVHL